MTATTIYFPRQGDSPPEPVPFILTQDDLARLLRMESSEATYFAFYRYRRKGWLKGTQIGKSIRYALPDALAFIEKSQKGNPR